MTDPMTSYDQYEAEQADRAQELRREQDYADARIMVLTAWMRTRNGVRSQIDRIECLLRDLERGLQRGPSHASELDLVGAVDRVGFSGLLRLLSECVKDGE